MLFTSLKERLSSEDKTFDDIKIIFTGEDGVLDTNDFIELLKSYHELSTNIEITVIFNDNTIMKIEQEGSILKTIFFDGESMKKEELKESYFESRK